MCCSAWPVSFTSTITGTWEVMVEDRLMHVLWYQNHVGSNNGPSGGNCLIIPIMGSWSSIRLLNTTSAPTILKDISHALRPAPEESLVLTGSLDRFGGIGSMVFLKFDIFDIVLAENAHDIARVLPEIDEKKRPKLNDGVFGVLDRWYKSPVALCCFNNEEAMEAKPIAFAFEPFIPEQLMVYTLDAHDGNPPDPTRVVTLDHTIFVGSYITDSEHGAEIRYSETPAPDLAPYILPKVMGEKLHNTKMDNGDFIFDVNEVRDGIFRGQRKLPPFAPKDLPRANFEITRQTPYAPPEATPAPSEKRWISPYGAPYPPPPLTEGGISDDEEKPSSGWGAKSPWGN